MMKSFAQIMAERLKLILKDNSCSGNLDRSGVYVDINFGSTNTELRIQNLNESQAEALINTLVTLKRKTPITPELVLAILGHTNQSIIWVEYAGDSLRFGLRDNRDPDVYNAKMEEIIATLRSHDFNCDRTHPLSKLSHGMVYQN